MKVNKVNVIYSRTVQMRQFEPATFSMSIEAQVDVTDREETVFANVKKMARDQVEEEINSLKKERKANIDNELELAHSGS